ncbi:Upstream activation factor subunit UAF30 [Gracilariopsis chorda]|uniref:Upstream activation factor subunit UAF30 n=1 Tax=Gracilariopsis chorda TaxID=448386 RepID=A0A2V3J822_9FLOR|nr:Upstream activation factor subunit UAF30 [Gracilariopsis chorda]|eukprot:PXF50092.1 Upstream activation factor subunit UAF30 [Gracilariopsis chorda]
MWRSSRRPLLFTSTFIPARVLSVPVLVPLPNHRCVARPSAVVASAPKIPAYRRPIVPAKILLPFVEDKAQTRSEIVRGITAYIKKHNLQDPKDRRTFTCDDRLKTIFGVESSNFLQVLKIIKPHLIDPKQLGGRYVVEAEQIIREMEQQYGDKPLRKKKMQKKSRARKKGAEEDMKAGTRLFHPVVLSDDLAAVCRGREMQRQEVVKAVWEYIRMNNLQNQGPPDNPVKCDFLLRKVYNTDYINVRTVMSGISPHLKKKE